MIVRALRTRDAERVPSVGHREEFIAELCQSKERPTLINKEVFGILLSQSVGYEIFSLLQPQHSCAEGDVLKVG
jgi:hypothetical protein